MSADHRRAGASSTDPRAQSSGAKQTFLSTFINFGMHLDIIVA
ncbi:hypothetical protein PCH70_13850 [Pseudomonas cichorii JBC1]|nr:hypothetical protein PCH70_13850 [Pseudomonas cichorii JBC1]